MQQLTARCRRCTPQAQATPDHICRLSRSKSSDVRSVGQVVAGCADADYTVRVFPGAPLGLLHKYHRDATGTGVVTLKYPPPILLALRGQQSKAAGARPRALMFRDAGALSCWLGINRLDIEVCASSARGRVSVIPQAPTSATAIDANRHVARSFAAFVHRYCCRCTCDAATFAPATLQASVRSGYKRASLIPVPALLGTEARLATEPMEVGEEPALLAVPEPLHGAKAAAAPNSTPKACRASLSIVLLAAAARMYETRLHMHVRYLCVTGLRACCWRHSRGRSVWFLRWLRVMR